MEDEEFYDEISDQEEVPVVPPAVVPVVAVAPLNVEVPEIPDNPESTSPEPSPAASPPGSPPPLPLWDLPSFMGFYTLDDIADLEQWAVEARAAFSQPELRVE